MSQPAPLPVVVLTGYLGSGKTSLLNAALADASFADSAVVVNEFGEIGLDHLLVSQGQENILLLEAGCLCCAILGSLRETLFDLYNRRARQETPPFQRVLVETTGLADPGPILQSVMRDPLLTPYFRLQGLACVVDAVFGADSLSQSPEAAAQAAMADRLIITKTDLTDGEVPSGLHARLDALNPTAPRVLVAPGAPCARDLLTFEDPREWALGEATGGGHRHDETIQSVSFRLHAPVSWAALAAWIDRLKAVYGRDLLRAKGILDVEGGAGPVILHGVQTLFETRRETAWPDDDHHSRLVLIGRGLDGPAIEAALIDATQAAPVHDIEVRS